MMNKIFNYRLHLPVCKLYMYICIYIVATLIVGTQGLVYSSKQRND